DNVTIGLEVSAQYHVSYDMGAGPADSGIYKSYYMLQEPVDQMRDFITDALRSSIPVYTLDEVFAKKDDIAKDVNATVSEQMAAYGFTLVSTLITKIALPTEVENSMNDINAAQRKRAAAQELAEADRIKRVTEATAEAEAMEKAGEGIANQRKAIALGIKDSLEIIQETGVGNDEANQLFMFTQWSEMMTEFARTGKTSTVVLPSDFSQSASMFEQMLAAGKVQNESKE
ncbi:MAG: SPFH domain-containing protein, partial [Collinsella sp.]